MGRDLEAKEDAMSVSHMSNEACRDQAMKALDRNDPVQAIAWINSAAAYTIGHKKTERYYAQARGIARDHGIECHGEFADDSDAV